MTKKPSEKNKAWEKDRRDRLNKTFDELAKLLPKFDPSVIWSKIEIIQKAITFIEELQKRLEDYLIAKDPELLKEYKEFVNCLRFYQERNAQLTESLKKAKISLPPVALPQLLLDKPELLPKVDNNEIVGVQKPKRQRNRTKKSGDDDVAKKAAKNVEKEKESSSEVVREKAENKPIKLEVIAKPTAIITAFGREIPNEAPKISTPQLPPSVPAKPLLLRIRKLRKHHQRLKLIPRPMFRKCYPHPSRMLKWNFETISNRKLLHNRKRNTVKRNHLHKETQAKHMKVEFNPESIREPSVSPTAAFLLSFPVVTPSMVGGKNVENADSSVNLENLNNFFTTEEYSKFCDQNTVVGEKILSPLQGENDEKPLTNEKQMTVFTVSAITRPSAPKKSNPSNSNRVNGILSAVTFDSCYNFNNSNPMIGSTSMCEANSQQVISNQYSSSNQVPATVFPVSISSADNKSSIKQEPLNPTTDPTCKSNSSEKFFPRYNHSTLSSLRTALESTPSNIPISSPRASQKGSVRPNLPLTTNWSVKSATPRGKSIANQTSSTKPSVMPFVSPTKNFFYDFPTPNRNATSSSSSSLSADPLISSTTAIKPQHSIKKEISWLPPNTLTTTTCNQNTVFTPFDLATIACDSLTSTSFTISSTTVKSSGPTVVETTSKATSNSRCNQINLFLPYEEAQYTPTFPLGQAKLTDSQLIKETTWKSMEKPKETTSDQIFYDCEQSKPQQKSHVNWMTSPTIDYTPTPTTTLPLPPIDFGNQFTGTSTNFDFSFGCRKDSYDDDNQFINWSPTKPLNADFSTTYSFENFGSNEPPPNKTVKQIFSVSQLVDQTPPQDAGHSINKKVVSKAPTQKSTPVKHTFSNIYSAESLIAKKDNSRFYSSGEPTTNTQSDYQNSGSYFFNYPNTQNCSENDYLGAGAYSGSQQPNKTSSIHPSAVAGGGTSSAMPPAFESTAPSVTTNNYFSHTISSNNNDPYDPTYFPSSNYNQSWNHGTPVAGAGGKAAASLNIYNQNQFGTLQEPSSCQQNSNVSGNLTNFNLSSICPEIDGKGGPNGW